MMANATRFSPNYGYFNTYIPPPQSHNFAVESPGQLRLRLVATMCCSEISPI